MDQCRGSKGILNLVMNKKHTNAFIDKIIMNN